MLNAANKKVSKHTYKVYHTKANHNKTNKKSWLKKSYKHPPKDTLFQRTKNKHNLRILTNCAGHRTMKEYLESVRKINLSLRISLK